MEGAKTQVKNEKGDDILLSVITDGRHAAIDLRFVLLDFENEPANKLNNLIANVHRVWRDTSDVRFRKVISTTKSTCMPMPRSAA